MTPPLKKIANSWPELIGVSLLFLILLPVILVVLIIAIPILGFETIWSRIRRAPHPSIPEIPIDTTRRSEVVAKDLAARAKELVKHLVINKDETSGMYTLTSTHLGERPVHIIYDNYSAYITIEGLNCYEWDIGSAENIDLYFWLAIGALRNGVYTSRSKFGRLGYWVKCDELGTWARVQKAGSLYDSILFYKQPPDSVKQKFALSATSKGTTLSLF
ncbi:MAG TPA: hypothetical protein VFT87_04850 [Candidatus Saccharimonadales bacterium]|nr:hypothetical protein [Candidatus Saccharimonadales bacterium]